VDIGEGTGTGTGEGVESQRSKVIGYQTLNTKH